MRILKIGKSIKNAKNVHIDKSYDVTPWIYVSKYVIHNSSAVGMQTSAMKKI